MKEWFKLAVCRRRTDPKYTNVGYRWEEIVRTFAKPHVTRETAAEYVKMKDEERMNCKDVGGFVAGELYDETRRNGYVKSVSVIVLDADNIKADQNSDFLRAVHNELHTYPYIIHSTHSSTFASPKYRIIIAPELPIPEELYPAITRAIARRIGIEYFDPTAFQPSRLFFFPSHPCDQEYFFESYNDDEVIGIDPERYLDMYTNCWDTAEYKMSDREKECIRKAIDKKNSMVPTKVNEMARLFNAAYSMHDAIETFLGSVYLPTVDPYRYQYIPARSKNGLVVYDDKYAVSYHATDPASDMLTVRDAFELVSVHKFYDPNQKVSFKRMSDFAAEDPKIKALIIEEKKKKAEALIESGNWSSQLEIDPRTGKIKNTLQNAVCILQNDEMLQGIAYNTLANRIEISNALPWGAKNKPWNDIDDAQLYVYLSNNYAAFSVHHINTALTKVCDDRSFDPVENFLDSLPQWDGIKRVDTLFVDYLGAPDNEYVKVVTRKTLCAAVKRIYEPGCKFDHVLVLVGPQGIGKSTIISRLAEPWFSDSLSLSDIRDKTGAEKIQGYWIIEISELAGLRKAEIESTRSFISRQDDNYRPAYGRVSTSHPRRCTFIGTSNAETGFLRDLTGNRRFWPVSVSGYGSKNPFTIDKRTIEQIWAEAKYILNDGETLYLSQTQEEMARNVQRDAMETDDREGMVKEFLETLLPQDWDKMDIDHRREYLEKSEIRFKKKVGTVKRTSVCTAEVWCECFGKDKADLKRSASAEIIAILRKLGWEPMDKKVRNVLYGPQYHYVPPKSL